MTTDSPKGAESEARPDESLHARVSEQFRVRWGYAETNELIKRYARDAIEVLSPELERLTAEVERLNDVRLNVRAQWRADLDEIASVLGIKKDLPVNRIVMWAKAAGDMVREAERERDEWKRAAETELREGEEEVSRLREQLAPAKLGAAVHQERADQLVIGLRRLLDRDREIENGPALVEPDESGVSSSEVEAPQPQEMVQHRVRVTKLLGSGQSVAVCPDCRAGMTGADQEAEDWKDQHEADTLRPAVGGVVKSDTLIGKENGEETFVPKDECRPSGSERLAPQPCACAACSPDDGQWRVIMHLCPQCGNKRCPGAKDHRQTCSGSNELGQPGSLYDFTEDRHLGQCAEDECLERCEEGYRACEFHVNLPAAQASRSEATPEALAAHANTMADQLRQLAALFDPPVSTQEETKEGETDA